MLPNHTLRISGRWKYFSPARAHFPQLSSWPREQKGLGWLFMGLHQPIHQKEITHGDVLTVDEVVWSSITPLSSNTTRHILCWSLGATAPVLVLHWDSKACEAWVFICTSRWLLKEGGIAYWIYCKDWNTIELLPKLTYAFGSHCHRLSINPTYFILSFRSSSGFPPLKNNPTYASFLDSAYHDIGMPYHNAMPYHESCSSITVSKGSVCVRVVTSELTAYAC